MDELLKRILQKDREYNAGDMAHEVFGFDRGHYDVLVVAPGWKPTKILQGTEYEVRPLAEHSYTSGYEVNMGGRRIAWAQTASGSCNLIDHLTICAELDYDKLVFVGAVGGLTRDVSVGDVCTPGWCVEGTMAPAYLMEDPRSFRPFGMVSPDDIDFVGRVMDLALGMGIDIKRLGVFCTDSIACEYFHLDFIKSFGADLIEMETCAFVRLANMLGKPAIALLAVSDNSASGEPLLGMGEEQHARYHESRRTLIPKIIERIAKL